MRTPPTPQTPRHRDTLPRKVFVTPSHRISSAATPLTPRTPRTPSTPSASRFTAVYNEGRQLFARSRNPGALVCREREQEELSDFLQTRVERRASGCMYVSGPPGTGKSALVRGVCGTYGSQANVRSAEVNCVGVKSATDLYGKLLEGLYRDADEDELPDDDEDESLKTLFFKRKETFLVILDEIDHFLDIDLHLLYTLFEYALHPESKLILVGIANALDFTDRFLPRLKAKNLKPELLPVMSYTDGQIAKVITARLLSLMPAGRTDFVPLIHPTAVHFLAKKISAQSGDLRKAFDICRSAIDLIETETRMKQFTATTTTSAVAGLTTPEKSPSKTPLMENVNLSSPPTSRHSPTKPLRRSGTSPKTSAETAIPPSLETAPRATISHMARVTAKALGHGSAQRLAVLNLQQKAALCALAALERKKKKNDNNNKNKNSNNESSRAKNPFVSTPTSSSAQSSAQALLPTTRSLYAAYTAMCTHDNVLHPLTNTEFRDVLGSLEGLGLVAYVQGGGAGGSGSGNAGIGAGGFDGSGTPGRSAPGSSGGGRKGRKPAFGFGFAGGAAVAEERVVKSVVGEAEIRASLEGAGSEIVRELLAGRALDYLG